MKSSILKSIIPIIIASAFVIGIVYSATWTAPTCGPTGCNTETPINVSGSGQIKNGGLTVGAALDSTSTGFVVLNGLTGIGTITPAFKLDVNGKANAKEICIDGDCKNSWPSVGGGAGSDQYLFQGSLTKSAGKVGGPEFNDRFGFCVPAYPRIDGVRTKTYSGSFNVSPGLTLITKQMKFSLNVTADDPGSAAFHGTGRIDLSCKGGATGATFAYSSGNINIAIASGGGTLIEIHNFGSLASVQNLVCNYTLTVRRTDSNCDTRIITTGTYVDYDDYLKTESATAY